MVSELQGVGKLADRRPVPIRVSFDGKKKLVLLGRDFGCAGAFFHESEVFPKRFPKARQSYQVFFSHHAEPSLRAWDLYRIVIQCSDLDRTLHRHARDK